MADFVMTMGSVMRSVVINVKFVDTKESKIRRRIALSLIRMACRVLGCEFKLEDLERTSPE